MSQIRISVKDMKGNETPLSILNNKKINDGKIQLGHDVNRVWKYDGNFLMEIKHFHFMKLKMEKPLSQQIKLFEE